MTFLTKAGSKIVELESKDMISNYMWRFRRSDSYLRNEWSNYTNWPYKNVLPQSLTVSPSSIPNPANFFITGNIGVSGEQDPYPVNLKNILIDMGITMDGIYREVVLPAGVYQYAEKYLRTTGDGKDGLYCYNFCLNSNKREYQPSGAMNVNRFKKIFFEFNTISVPLEVSGNNVEYICDLSGNAIGFRKLNTALDVYSFDLRVFEERYNVMIIQGRSRRIDACQIIYYTFVSNSSSNSSLVFFMNSLSFNKI